MADFSSELGSGLKNRLVPNESALDRKIDFQREKFLKGIRTTRSGKKEDPTYISFRFIFDFAESGLLEEETFLPVSPLFRGMDQKDGIRNGLPDFTDRINEFLDSEQARKTEGKFQEEALIDALLNIDGGFSSSIDFFYGTKLKEQSRRNALYSSHGGFAYMGAEAFLRTKSSKRGDMIKAFKSGLRHINQNSPWYFQSLSGLNTLVSSSIPRYGKPTGKSSRTGELTISCLESIDMRISALAELYRKAVYDYTHHRVMLPENLRKFRMWVVITEIRNIQMDIDANDILNPFSIPAAAKIANIVSNFNSQTGLLDSTEKLLNKSTRPDLQAVGSNDISSNLYSLQPYVYIYQLDQCEFDFDSTHPSFDTINNSGGQMVSTSFKINVGRVKDYKIQFSELGEYKDNNSIKGMIISDVWGNAEQGYTLMDYDKSSGLNDLEFDSVANPGDYFADLASNFISNTVSTIKDEAVSFLQSTLLGNIYGFQPSELVQNSRDLFSLVNGLKDGVPNPFRKSDPQSAGLGGPGQRQYPRINEDLYPPNNGIQPGTDLGNVINEPQPNNQEINTDVYSGVPGTDLGRPSREYPSIRSDEYSGTPGGDLGVPDRIYSTIRDDSYPTNPGVDLGLPERTYPSNNDDQYMDVPGVELGVPDRIYASSRDDLYEGVPGPDLGLPERSYPSNNDDQYENVPGSDLGLPGRVYSTVSSDQYDGVPGTDLGLPDRAYPEVVGDEYSEVPGTDLGKPNRVYEKPAEDKFQNVPGSDLGNPDRVYPGIIQDEYKDVPGSLLGVPSRVYQNPAGDQYQGVPGSDLGLPSRDYKPSVGDEYNSVPGASLGPSSRVYNSPKEDVYNGIPGSDLGLPERRYEGIIGDEYADVPGVSLGPLGRVYDRPNNDLYPTVSGVDLELPQRNYGEITGESEYSGVPGQLLGAPQRIYPKTNFDVYPDNSLPESIGKPNLSPIGEISSRRNIPMPDKLASKDPVYTQSDLDGRSVEERSKKISSLSDVYRSVENDSRSEQIFINNNDPVYKKDNRFNSKQLGRIYPNTDEFGNLII